MGAEDNQEDSWIRDVARTPVPPESIRPWLAVIGILSLVWVWAGIVGVLLGLYLLSAEAWTVQEGAGGSIAVLVVIGFAMAGLGVAAYVQSRRGWLEESAWCLGPAVLLQIIGAAIMGGARLPFAGEAAGLVLGLQVLPALMILGGYFLFEWYRSSIQEHAVEQARLQSGVKTALGAQGGQGGGGAKRSAARIVRALKRRRAIVRRRR